MDYVAPKPNKPWPVSGSHWVHGRTGVVYAVIGVMPIKLDGLWIPGGAVVYGVHERNYIRMIADFMVAFEPLPDEQRIEPLSPEQYEQNLFHHGIVR